MSAVASTTVPELDVQEPLSAIALAESALADMLVHCERLHRAHIEHDPHSCFLCFETR